jgi:P27 family predicted phage terminase small subunit
MFNNNQIAPPSHLSEDAKAFFSDIAKRYELESHHIHLLVLACENLDRRSAALKRLEDEGLTILDSKGTLRCHPCTATARDAGVQFMRAMRELNLDSAAEESRPPALRRASIRRV